MIRTRKRISSGYFEESFEVRDHLSKERPVKSLIKKIKRNTGRDNTGRISVRHKGAGAKRLYRVISTLDQFKGEQVKVLRLEYDPNRSANIALVELPSGIKKYIIAPDKLIVGETITSQDKVKIAYGNRSKLENIPIGVQLHDVQLYPESKKFIARSAGTYATLMALDGIWALLKLPSGELRKINRACFATIGQVSNIDHKNIKIGKAGRMRKMGVRPTVRGKAMHPGAHPHGGGEGVNPIGLKYPKTPWGKVAIGHKTRGKKISDKFIVKRAKVKR